MPNMGSFSPNMSPEDLRNLVIFPTFMIHLPKILDKAVQGIFMTSFDLIQRLIDYFTSIESWILKVSKYFMQLILNLLIFCPANGRIDMSQIPTYSLVWVFRISKSPVFSRPKVWAIEPEATIKNPANRPLGTRATEKLAQVSVDIFIQIWYKLPRYGTELTLSVSAKTEFKLTCSRLCK